MVLADPLQWAVIGVIAFVGVGVIAYVLLRVLQMLTKVDRYIDTKEKETKTPVRESTA
jgi:hypothetical protein